MNFKLSEDEILKFNAWKKTLPKIPVDVFGEDFMFTYKFHPTGLGVQKIIERADGETLDLTDYHLW